MGGRSHIIISQAVCSPYYHNRRILEEDKRQSTTNGHGRMQYVFRTCRMDAVALTHTYSTYAFETYDVICLSLHIII